VTVLDILPYALPPLLGAVIGYVTNYLAIRMLFRPLTEKRVLGLRLPFTPGIIPRQRYQLSESIARMVSTRLITPDVLQAKLNEPEFEATLVRSVSRFTADLIEGRSGPSDSTRGDEGMRGMVTTILAGVVSSPAFRDAARQLVRVATEGALRMSVGQVSPRSETIHALIGRVLSGVSTGATAAAVRESVIRWVRDHVAADTPLHEVVGPGTLDKLGELLPRSYMPILESVLTFLKQPDTREELSVHGRDLMSRILKRLSLVQRLVVSAGQYDRNLSQNMPDIVSDVIASLEKAGRNPETRSRIVAVFRSKLAEWGETGVGTLSSSLGFDLSELADRAVTFVLAFLGREEIAERVSGAISTFLDQRADRTVAEVIGDTVNISEEEVKSRAVDLVDRWLERPDASTKIAEQISRFISGRVASSGTSRLGAFVHLTPDQKAGIDATLARKLREQLELRVPELINGLDVHGMVVQKIDGLDVESVEQLLLMVIARHLKWINLFGALLGALIGGIQVVVSRLM